MSIHENLMEDLPSNQMVATADGIDLSVRTRQWIADDGNAVDKNGICKYGDANNQRDGDAQLNRMVERHYGSEAAKDIGETQERPEEEKFQGPTLRARNPNQLTEKGKVYKAGTLVDKRAKTLTKLQNKAKAIDKLLYSAANRGAVKEGLDQYSDLFKLLTTYHREYCELSASDDLEEQAQWFENLDEDVFHFKHKIHNWIKETTDRSSRASLKSSSKVTSCSSKTSKSSKSSAKLKLLEEKAKIAELEAEAAFLVEKQKAENQATMMKLQGEVARAKARARIYEEFNNMENQECNETGERMEKPQYASTCSYELKRLAKRIIPPTKEMSLKNEEAFIEKVPYKKTSYALKENHIAGEAEEPQNMVDMMSKLLRQQAAPEIDIDTFHGNPTDYHYFIAVFEEVVEKKIDDPRGRLTRLIKYTQGEPKDMIKHCIQQPSSIGYKNARKLLEEKYGNINMILAAYRKEIKSWPQLVSADGAAFRKFYNFLIKCDSASYGNINTLDTPEMMCLILSKLPGYIRERWNRAAMSIRRRYSREPCLKDLIAFVDDEVTLINDPLFSKEALTDYVSKRENQNRRSSAKVKSFATGSTKISCHLCQKDHDLDNCDEFNKKSIDERSKFLYKEKLCYGCYLPISSNHSARTCPQRRTCSICNEKHPTGLHGYKGPKKTTNKDGNINKINNLTCATTGVHSKVVSMCIVPVKIKHATSPKEIHTYAMLDCCSQGTFIHEDLRQSLKINGIQTTVRIKTLNGEENMISQAISGLKVSRLLGESSWIDLPVTYSKDNLPVGSDDIATPENIQCWEHLKRISNEITQRQDIQIGILIGGNCSKALEPLEIIPSQEGGPYAFRTILGWCVVGPISMKTSSNHSVVSCNRIAVQELTSSKIAGHYYAFETSVKDIGIEEMLYKLYSEDFSERKISSNITENLSEISIEDRKFLDLMDNHCSREGKHYKLPLPLRNTEAEFPSNKKMIEARLQNLKKRFKRDKQYHNDYTNFMEDIIKKGYAEKIGDITGVSKNSWFIPHHGIYHPSKPGKIRVVFDCSAEMNGISINKELMSGPDLTNQLVGILMRFRKESIAVMADIESMFYQVFVTDNQRNLLSFLWWEKGNYNQSPQVYQMCVHVFGSTSSPSCCNYALRKTANDYEVKYGKEVADILRNDFYVDDLLKSMKDEQTAEEVIKKVKDMCAEGGFRLTKFVSNSKHILSSILEADRRTGLKDRDLQLGNLPTEKALGIFWNVEEDKLRFDINFKEKPTTKRGLLSLISSIYDPLGLVSPFVLEGKQIIQRLCHSKFGWDEPINEDIKEKWLKWRQNISQLKDVQINRCYKPKTFGDSLSCSLHYFSDASENGYGQATYLRMVDVNGNIHCSLVMAKSRVTPMKYTSIPRLELAAAVLSIKISEMIKKYFKIADMKEYFWTDSQVVLGYIKSSTKRFKIFVANRVQQIRENSQISQWKYVPSKMNPADFTSRGLSGNNCKRLKMWFNGPEFLWKSEFQWPKQIVVSEVARDDVEVKANICVNATIESTGVLQRLEELISDWNKMRRVVAWILKYKKNLQRKIKDLESNEEHIYPPNELNVALIKEAEEAIIKLHQHEKFNDEITNLKNHSNSYHKSLMKKSKVFKLDPYIDSKGLLRVGGRLRRSNLHYNDIHPILLGKEGIITNLILKWCHEKTAHGGRGMTMNEVRSNGFWIIKCNTIIRRLLGKCVKCRLLRGKLGQQKMADLPNDRMIEGPPFTNCAVDMFGPFMIKEGRKELKRYGALFTCLSSRAVHIETTCSMDTDSFIQALRRFIARRGNIRILRCDNGSNFIGAKNDLEKAFNEMDCRKVKQYLENNGADLIIWKRNPPAASHMGGVWERQIRSARNILSSLLYTHGRSLNDESFRTLLAETEAILNSRPLTADTLGDVQSEQPLCPNNILTMKSKVILPPPGKFVKQDLFSRKRWRRIQHIANEFWVRWRKEYLWNLQERQKWNKKSRNFQVGDIVLLKADVSRNQWPLAKVVKTNNDEEGNVRSVLLQLGKSKKEDGETILERPISKIVLIKESEVRFPDEEADQDECSTS